MSNEPKDQEPRPVRVLLSLSRTEIAQVDDARGTHPRAAYIREVLVNHQRSAKAKP